MAERSAEIEHADIQAWASFLARVIAALGGLLLIWQGWWFVAFFVFYLAITGSC